MLLRTLADEALRNLCSRWLLATLVGLVACGVGAGTVLFSAAEVGTIRRTWDRQVAEGRFVYELRGSGPDGVDSARCDALNAWPAVVAAGGRIRTDSIHPVTSPGSTYELDHVTTGYLGVIWPGVRAPGPGHVVAGPYASESLGLRAGTPVAWETDGATGVSSVVAAVPPHASLRDESADRHLFATAAPTGAVDRCLVEIDPGHRAAVLAALGAWFSGDAVHEARSLHDFSRSIDPQAALRERTSRWTWWGGAGLIASVTVLSWSFRRADAALYQLVGVGRASIAVLVAVDVLVASITPAIAGVGLALAVRASALADGLVRSVVLADAARLLATLALLPLLCAGLVLVRSVFVTLKEA